MTQIIAHRGASATYAEMTLAAYIEAIEVGSDVVECDIRLTKDGEIVLFHDRTLKRTVGVDRVVSNMTLAELQTYDFAAWKRTGERDPERPWELDTIMTLRQLFELVRDAGRRVEIAVETKHPVRQGGKVEHALAAMLREFGWDGADSPVRMMSFQITAVWRMHLLTPKLRLVILIDGWRHWKQIRHLLGRRWIVGPGLHVLFAHPELVAWCRNHGHDISIWTVNDEAGFQLCVDHGVDAITSDKPAWALALREHCFRD